MRKWVSWTDGDSLFIGEETGDYIAEFPLGLEKEVERVVEYHNVGLVN